jgi:NADP-dependent 3-hydroxy acid dehydrogenase YdfG
MLLSDKTAIVYGAGGAIGSAVSRAFGREGAHVFLTGRTKDALEKTAQAIHHSGGAAEVAQVDAVDPAAVGEHAMSVVRARGAIDIVFNATANDDVQAQL